MLSAITSLEDIPHRKLDLARRAEAFRPPEGVEELSEAGRRQEVRVRRRGQLKSVDDVVNLDSHLHFLVVTERHVLEQRNVRLHEMRTAFCVASKVAECAGRGIRESGRV